MKMRMLLLLLAALWVLTLPADAADWPQWRGPHRTDVSTETGLLKTWPKDGPRLLWTYSDAGNGYSSPAVVGDRLFTMGTRNDRDCVFALDVKTGKEVWSAKFVPVFHQDRGDGPRGTPTVAGDLLYGIGGQGELVCVETATGKIRWQVSLKKDLGGQMMSGWGYSESPLVDGNQVICTPGGSKGTLAALDRQSGKLIWQSKELTDLAAYSSCIVAEVGGLRQYIQVTGSAVAGVAAKDGRLLWRYPKDDFRTAVVPTPIFHDNQVYVTAGYGSGCALLKLTPNGNGTKAEKVYANKNMTNHHGGVVRVGEYVYGFSDSERNWICQNFQTGETVWSGQKKLGKGSLTCADGHLYCYSESDGTLVLVEASPKGWKEDGRFKIPRETTIRSSSGKIWTHPVVANGRLYLRDQDLIFCFDVQNGALSAR
jgi:outer membrane protein assembly factor BamB